MCIWLHGVAAKLLGGLMNPVYEWLEPGVDPWLAVLGAGLPPGDDPHLGGALVPVHPQRPARVPLARVHPAHLAVKPGHLQQGQ